MPEYIENCYLQIDSTVDLGKGGAKKGVSDNRILKFRSTPELSTSKSAEFAAVPILGRANPIHVYGSSSEKAWNLELKFFAEDFGNGRAGDQVEFVFETGAASGIRKANEEVRRQVTDKINWCEALTYPIYSLSGVSQGPPSVSFVFGDLLNTRCICTDVQVSYPGPWFIKADAMLGWPMYGIVNLTLKQIGGGSTSYRDVRDNLHQNPKGY